MKMSKEAAKMFATEIARAKARGRTHFAKAVGSPTMRFGMTLEDAEKKAAKDARRIARRAGCPTMPPSVQSGELAGQFQTTKQEGGMTQAERLINHFQTSRTIDPLRALRELGIFCLAERIRDLRKKGYAFKKEMIPVKNQFGEKCRVACYEMEKAQ